MKEFTHVCGLLSSIPQMFRDYVLQRKKKGQGQSAAKRVADKVAACQAAQESSGFNLDELTYEELEMPAWSMAEDVGVTVFSLCSEQEKIEP